ncbi:MAG: GIY-YIG nuclease family protein [Candidatus Tectomicrobia bacterium]|nr:GIY-YIG nuclease family protein [Candidatus Tectomicrobia bacterium]
MQVLLFGWLRWMRRLWLLGFSGWCVFPGCGTRIKARYQLCHNHFLAASRYQWEHRDGWGKKDKQADAFWVYLLELDGGGSLYAGQTRNLMRRMQEHGQGTTKTTAGRRPRLAWFEQVPTRQAAVEREADLKHRIDTQPGEVRQMVAAFRSR